MAEETLAPSPDDTQPVPVAVVAPEAPQDSAPVAPESAPEAQPVQDTPPAPEATPAQPETQGEVVTPSEGGAVFPPEAITQMLQATTTSNISTEVSVVVGTPEVPVPDPVPALNAQIASLQQQIADMEGRLRDMEESKNWAQEQIRLMQAAKDPVQDFVDFLLAKAKGA